MNILRQIPNYCICLPENRKRCDAFFAALRVRPIYTDVVWKGDLDRQNLIHTKRLAETSTLRSGVVACALSHVNALNAFLSSDADVCVVFEDDNDLPDDLLHVNDTIHHILRLGIWDYVNLSPCFSECSKVGLVPITGSCTNCYMIRRSGAMWLTQHIFPLHEPIDFLTLAIPNAFEFHPRLFRQNEAPSNLGNLTSPPECQPTKTYPPECQPTKTYPIILLASIVSCFIVTVTLARGAGRGGPRSTTRRRVDMDRWMR
jgi:hypothetical protein